MVSGSRYCDDFLIPNPLAKNVVSSAARLFLFGILFARDSGWVESESQCEEGTIKRIAVIFQADAWIALSTIDMEYEKYQ
jgi:hypothetical protein